MNKCNELFTQGLENSKKEGLVSGEKCIPKEIRLFTDYTTLKHQHWTSPVWEYLGVNTPLGRWKENFPGESDLRNLRNSKKGTVKSSHCRLSDVRGWTTKIKVKRALGSCLEYKHTVTRAHSMWLETKAPGSLDRSTFNLEVRCQEPKDQGTKGI